jgi:pimeloyl-ACP methyl ester carboxylesterase
MALKSVASGVFAETYGAWPPAVVALHGWGRRGSDFDPVLVGLDAIAIDLPGFGASPPPDHAIGARGYADLLEPVLDQLSAPPVLVGHSFGGRVAVCLASRRPVAGLVLTGVPLLRSERSGTPPLGFRLLRWANRRRLVSDERMERVRRNRGSSDYRAATGVMRDVLVTAVNESYEAELALVNAPVSLVWGGDDRDVPPGVATSAEAVLRAADREVSVTVLAGVGHFVPGAAPDALRAVIDSMLAR